jgi:hypothetical protein
LNNLLPTFPKAWRKDGCDLELTLQVSQVVDPLGHMGIMTRGKVVQPLQSVFMNRWLMWLYDVIYAYLFHIAIIYYHVGIGA